jgi:hypothetical protein
MPRFDSAIIVDMSTQKEMVVIWKPIKTYFMLTKYEDSYTFILQSTYHEGIWVDVRIASLILKLSTTFNLLKPTGCLMHQQV